MASGSATTAKKGLVRYMAPEQIDPPQFNQENSNPSKKSDVYSLVMTAYEVRFPSSPVGRLRTSCYSQVLTGVKPYANKREGDITVLVTAGTRPSRPAEEAVDPLPNLIWETMESCWSQDLSSRLSISDVHSAFLLSAGNVNGK